MGKELAMTLFHIIIQAANVYIYLKYYFKDKIRGRKFEVMAFAIYICLRIILKMEVSQPLVLIIYDIISFIGISYCYKSSFIRRLFYSTFTIMIFTLTHSIISLMVPYYHSSLMEIITEQTTTVAIYSEIVNLMIILMLMLLRKVKNVSNMDLVARCGLVYVPAITIFILGSIYNVAGISTIVKIIILILLIELNFLCLYFFNNITNYCENLFQSRGLRQQAISYEHELAIMQENFKNISILKHDMKNHLSVLYGLVESNQNEECLEYLRKTTALLESEKVFANSKNIVIDSIINFKLYELSRSNAEIEVNICVSPELSVSSFDITSILGNLLDNAIEAATVCEENKYLYIGIKQMKGMLEITVRNSFDGTIREKEGSMLSRKRSYKMAGTGMERIQNLVDKYNGVMTIKADGFIFVTKIMIYLT
ncbi:MAG: sensor histidine kinase [Lachnospiraceae bacterium]